MFGAEKAKQDIWLLIDNSAVVTRGNLAHLKINTAARHATTDACAGRKHQVIWTHDKRPDWRPPAPLLEKQCREANDAADKECNEQETSWKPVAMRFTKARLKAEDWSRRSLTNLIEASDEYRCRARTEKERREHESTSRQSGSTARPGEEAEARREGGGMRENVREKE